MSVLNVEALPFVTVVESVSVPALPLCAIIYSLPDTPDAVGRVNVTPVEPVKTTMLCRSSRVVAAVVVIAGREKDPALCRVLVGAVVPIPIRADGVTLEATTVTRSLVSPPTAIRKDDVPVFVFRLVARVMSRESKYAISPSTMSVPTPNVAAAFLFPSVLSQCTTDPAAVFQFHYGTVKRGF